MGQKKHWSKFRLAAKEIMQQGQDCGHPEIKMVCEGTAVLISSKIPKFYVPNADGLLSEKDMPPEGEMVNLPYPIICILSETKILSKISDEGTIVPSNDEAWMLTIAIQKETDGHITLMSATHNREHWAFSPIAVQMQRGSGKGFELGVIMTGAAEEMIRRLKAEIARLGLPLQEPIEATIVKDFAADMTSVCVLWSLLKVHDTKTVKVPMPAVLERKPPKGSPKPNYDYHVLSVGDEVWDSPYTKTNAPGGGVRSHLRRGHIRRLESKSVWVRSTFVHGSKEGFVEKDYEVKGSSNAVQEPQRP